MKVTCDSCTKVFNVKLKEKNRSYGIIETYFTCKHCKKRYTSFVTDRDVRRWQREIKQPMTADERSRVFNMIKRTMAMLKADVIQGRL